MVEIKAAAMLVHSAVEFAAADGFAQMLPYGQCRTPAAACGMLQDLNRGLRWAIVQVAPRRASGAEISRIWADGRGLCTFSETLCPHGPVSDIFLMVGGCKAVRVRFGMSDSVIRSAENRRKLLAYIARRDRNPSSSEDILQETLLRLLEQSRKQAIQDPMAYAFRIADTVIFARARQRKRETELGDMDFESDVPMGEEVLEYKQRAAFFRDALLAMTPTRRAVFVKRHLEGKSRQDIADETGLSLEAVKKHLLRAMAELASLNATFESPAKGAEPKRVQ